MSIELEFENVFQLKATVRLRGRAYAFYLYLRDEILERTPYSSSNTFKFSLQKPGVYRVKWYVRSATGETASGTSDRIGFSGFPDSPPVAAAPSYGVFGITRAGAFAAHVLAVKGDVKCFIDSTGHHVGTEFFGRPVVGVDDVPADLVVVGHEGHMGEMANLVPFSFAAGTVDVLTTEFHRFGAMELYRIAREAHLEGLTTGAFVIEHFIQMKYNCRVPFKARIGEGTRLGIGGIGTIIHPESIIGRDCVIAQSVTLGMRGGGNGAPVIGDNVFIGPGAKCFGGKIGSNVVIGANAVVLTEIPDNCVVAGVPARIISTDIEKYGGYTNRPTRPSHTR